MDKRKLMPKRQRLDGAVRTGPLNGKKQNFLKLFISKKEKNLLSRFSGLHNTTTV
jgi:hypothetical protein